MSKRSDFPAEDDLPKDMHELYDLLLKAQEAKLSFRYTNVIRHRLMDAVADAYNERRL